MKKTAKGRLKLKVGQKVYEIEQKETAKRINKFMEDPDSEHSDQGNSKPTITKKGVKSSPEGMEEAKNE